MSLVKVAPSTVFPTASSLPSVPGMRFPAQAMS